MRMVYVLLVVLAAILGTAGALGLAVSRTVGGAVVAHAFRSSMDFAFDPAGVGVWFLVSIGLAAVAGAWPALRAARAPVREALAHE